MKTLLLGSLCILLGIGAGCATTQNNNVNSANTSVEVSAEDSVDMVTEDAYGSDLEQVARYPDSLRSYYSTSKYETAVTYQTIDSVNDVRTFFDDNLKAAGWTNTGEATDLMEYSKGDEENPELITIYFTDYKSQGLVEYELVYEPALSEADLNDLELDDSSF